MGLFYRRCNYRSPRLLAGSLLPALLPALVAALVLALLPALGAGCRAPVPEEPDAREPAPEGLAPPFAVTFGGPGIDDVSGLALAGDGGYLLAGGTKPSDADDWDAWLVKVDAAGAQTWSRTLGGEGHDTLSCVRPTADGGYVASGITASAGAGDNDAWLIRLTAAGDTLWSRSYGGAGMEYAWSVTPLADGGCLVAGGTESPEDGSWDALVVRTDSSGEPLWMLSLGGPDDDGARAACAAADGSFIVAGETRSTGAGAEDIWLIKLSAQGEQLWSQTFGGADPDWAWDVEPAGDDGFIIAGCTQPPQGPQQALLLRVDGEGRPGWMTAYDQGGPSDAMAVRATADGGFIVAGGLNYDFWLWKTDDRGQTTWSRVLGAAEGDVARAVEVLDGGGFIAAGSTSSYGAGNSDALLVRTDETGSAPAP